MAITSFSEELFKKPSLCEVPKCALLLWFTNKSKRSLSSYSLLKNLTDIFGKSFEKLVGCVHAVLEALSSLLHSIIYMLSQREVIFMILPLNYAY